MASFSDDFNRPDSTDLGASWVEVSGDWSIASSRLSPGAAGGVIILRAAGAMASSDHYVQVTIAATTAASHGIWARGNSSGGLTSGYLFRNDGSTWDVFSVVGGSFTVIGTYSAAAAPGDVAKLQVVGSTITAYVNGTLRVSVVDTAVPTGTSVGLRSESTSGIKFDNVSAADVTAGTTLGIASSTESAQPLTGAKTATLGTAAEASAAQALTGSKAGALGVANALESAQPLTGSKAATLSTASATETAQAITGAKTAALGTAAASEAAQPLTGSKLATLGPAMETSTARPLNAAGPDVDIDVTVSAPYSRWAVGEPRGEPWPVSQPDAAPWLTGAPY